MESYLAIQVRLHDGRYHGAGDWPPSPARLYQALIAGVGLGGPIPESAAEVFRWLESLPAPEIIVPQQGTTTVYTSWVPNNDLDAKKGDPRQIGGIRTGKTIHAYLFDESQPLHYLWPLPDGDEPQSKARALVEIADRLYQFGRGVDMAWAIAEVLDESAIATLREGDGFARFAPDFGSQGTPLQTPVAGTYQSLENRYQAGSKRFTISRSGRSISKTFSQTPQARFRSVSYNSSPSLLLFDLRRDDEEGATHSAPLESVATLTETIRDAAWEKLRGSLPDLETELDRCLLGKNSDGSHAGTSKDRITIIPIPSIGHHHADMLVRRVAVLISPTCRLPLPDLRWAFSNLKLGFQETPILLQPAADKDMLSHYAPSAGARAWRTISPICLPENAARRRIPPDKKRQEAKGAIEKGREEIQAIASVIQALRHAGFRETGAIVTRIQRVPFQANGKRVEDFAPGSRFAKERLWHVAIQFAEPVRGPLVLGDGRFLGLGVFSPCAGDNERP